MDGRRPRIKPTVNLQPKRKIDAVKLPQTTSTVSSSSLSTVPEKSETNTSDNTSNVDNNVKIESFTSKEQIESPFKRPQDIRNSTLLTTSSDNNIDKTIPPTSLDTTIPSPQIEVQENVINNSSPLPQTSSQAQQQQQKLSKHRQRIRPTPCFGTARRSSIQGNSVSDTEEEYQQHHRRQRHLSEQGGQQTIGIIEKVQLGGKTERNSTTVGETDGCSSNIGAGRDGGTSTTDTPTTENEKVNLDSINRNQIPSRYRKVSSSEDVQQRHSLASKRTPMKYNMLKPVEKFEKSSMKMLDFIYYNPTSNPMVLDGDKTTGGSTVTTTKTESEYEKESSVTNNSDVQQENAPAVPVPQLKLGPNGEVILDEQSLVIQTTAEKEGRKNLLKSNILYLDDNTGSNGFYRRQKRTREWSSEETIKFYRCLHTVGTDFSLMLTLFPNRTRRELKLKFKKEEKTNLGLINKALLFPKAFNVEELRKELEKDEIQKAEKLKRVVRVTKKPAPKKRECGITSKVLRTLCEGDSAYENTDLCDEKIINKKRKIAKNDENNDELGLVLESNKNDEILDEQTMFDALVNDDDNKSNASTSSKNEMDNLQDDIDSDIEEFAKDSLVLVSSEDPNDPGKIINEIYVMNKETNELSDKPLDLSEDVIDCIVSEIQEQN